MDLLLAVSTHGNWEAWIEFCLEGVVVQALDAVYLDSSRLTVEEVEQAILKLIRETTSNGKEIH